MVRIVFLSVHQNTPQIYEIGSNTIINEEMECYNILLKKFSDEIEYANSQKAKINRLNC